MRGAGFHGVVLMLLTVGIVRGTEPAPGNEIEIVYMSRERPVLMHVLLPSQEAPLPTRWNEWMTDWFSFLDRDSSGVLDRAEFDRSPSPSQVLAQRRAGLYPRLGDVGADFKAADLDGSSSIDREELTAYYRTGGVGPLDVIAGQCDMAWAETLTAEMFEALDRDGDGGLSGGELRQAMESLGRLDADDDELIMVSEIMPTPPPPRIETVSSRFLVPTLGAHSWEQETRSLADALSMHYGVDIDARTLRRRRPDVTCLVELTRGERGGSVVGDGKRVEAASRFGLADAIVALHPAPTPRGVAPGVRDFFLQQVRNASRIDPDRNAWKRWATDRFALLALVEPLADRDEDGEVTEAEVLRLVDLHIELLQRTLTARVTGRPSTPFDLLDSDSDGRLSVYECQAAAAGLLPWDRSGDGILQPEELPFSFEWAFCLGPADGRKAGAMSGTGARGPDRHDEVPGWFLRLDHNRDFRVSRREFIGTDLDFRQFDADGDSLIDCAESRTTSFPKSRHE